jgi:hypothetical protein
VDFPQLLVLGVLDEPSAFFCHVKDEKSESEGSRGSLPKLLPSRRLKALRFAMIDRSIKSR